MMPVVLSQDNAVPELGKATTRIDVIDGHARLVSSMSRQDMKALLDYFKTIANSGKKTPAGPPKIDPPETMEKKPEPKKKVKDTIDVPKQDVAYWFDQGYLFATYGNDEAAIQYFKKALTLEPNNSRVLYELGVCYGEIGKIRLAMEFIDKALSIYPEKGLYYYGKARIRLMSGDKESAIEDFKKAASLGHRDAQDYLQNSLHIASQ
jgi:tetratricopeptide (TPR) repeat protein